MVRKRAADAESSEVSASKKEKTDDNDSPPSASARDKDLFELGDIENCDPEGDVIIICGDGAKFRVSSAMLSLASPVFKALLRPGGFKEGNVPRSSSAPLRLELPEEEDPPMGHLLRAMHFSEELCSSEGELECQCYNFPEPKQLAMLADKYRCVPAVYYICDRWIDDLMHPEIEIEELDYLAHAAYLTRNKQKFVAVTASMLDSRSCDLNEVTSTCLRGLLQTKKIKQTDMQYDIAGSVQYSIESLEGLRNDRHTMNEGNACTADRRMKAHLRSLKRAGLQLDELADPDRSREKSSSDSYRDAIIYEKYDCTENCPLHSVQRELKSELEPHHDMSRGVTLQEFLDALGEPVSEW